MAVEIVNLGRVLRKLEDVKKTLFSKRVFALIGEYIKATIKARDTETHVDAEGKSFGQYSDRYAKVRQEAGYPIDHVYLDWSGQMHAAMTSDARSDRVDVFFRNMSHAPTSGSSGSSVSTSAEIAYHLNQHRKFFALSTKQIDKILEIYREEIRRSLRR